jgi:D-beta-D-heptose 7-phosphate kinase/D-beta-D-heptose 1-phosphate adenosyltransferase
MKKIIVVSGGFDPIHSGHIKLINNAKELGDILVVGINSDNWLIRKKGKFFMPWQERKTIVSNLKAVDYVIEFNDDDGSALHLLKLVRQTWQNDRIIFANGGDRNETNNNEVSFQDDNFEFAFGIGGSYKSNSSSSILEQWENR